MSSDGYTVGGKAATVGEGSTSCFEGKGSSFGVKVFCKSCEGGLCWLQMQTTGGTVADIAEDSDVCQDGVPKGFSSLIISVSFSRSLWILARSDHETLSSQDKDGLMLAMEG
ncbi:hypothetical protein MUK42_02342 [Musa troglodytarum]|uniref:Uncharacterized protein n=1 Tax=Musa troglodytarum TaxID=320322 RepID=A0A9E7GK59_9LILI|nr:hypothetical protein MUK42_02342 [Musa troglodytarum]